MGKHFENNQHSHNLFVQQQTLTIEPFLRMRCQLYALLLETVIFGLCGSCNISHKHSI